ncbi:Conserved Hypothetical Protein [Streptomyces leeuwenhoekii]|uniref:Glyoxalase-like domain-containing protein n=1 Tax=Streptomyces leeuwenhoekii TaxID=1437453 RepID=A0A0F7W9H7_STRLW|nr:Conserved Hypothetical Protein [Streptomyces leeuwenhoekii]
MPLRMKLSAITLDCADPQALAEFYRQATGLRPYRASNGDFAGLTSEEGLFLGFQRADGHRPPTWPGRAAPQQTHLDFQSTISARPRPGSWNWAPPSRGTSPTRTGGGCSSTRPGTRSA